MPFAVAVQMDGKGQIGGGRVFINVLFQEQRIGAEIDEFFAADKAPDDPVHFLVDQRLAARDRDHRGAAFINGGHAVIITQALV